MKPHYTNTNNRIDFPKTENNMNERIKKFAEESGLYFKLENGSLYPSAMSAEECESAYKKFAQLIVRECLEQVRDEVQYEYDWKLADAVSKRVLEHFGVEE